ncbi:MULTISPECIES: hypothetical protein [unclassified Enterococcus]|uniref:hypothetical protein n=1 Tax=unclassified Enterococcus TaxID=2608891 RepID=UPI0005581F33
MVDTFTLLLFLFVVIMFLFLWIVRREIIYKAVRKKGIYLIVPLLAVFAVGFTLMNQPTLDELLKGILAAMIFLSFLLDSRGITENGLVLNSFDKKGVPFSEIEKVVLYQPEGSTEVKMNFFRNGWRGPLLKFAVPLEELVAFLSTHMRDDAEIDIMVDSE